MRVRRTAVIYRNGVALPSKKKPPTPVEGGITCPRCQAQVRARNDGTPHGHAIGGGKASAKNGRIPCL